MEGTESHLTLFFIGAMASHASKRACGHELGVGFETVSHICWGYFA